MPSRLDLTGRRFGKLQVTAQFFEGCQYCECLCDCGNIKKVKAKTLREGKSQSCGCIRTPNLVGMRFGSLTVIRKTEEFNNAGALLWEALCGCGNTVKLIAWRLATVKSCGCQRGTHNLRDHPLYTIWANIKQRCYTVSSASYKNYGGRGISVCDEWRQNFKAFYDWSLNNGWLPGLSIERVNNDGNYCPENCKWIPLVSQAENKRSNCKITVKGKTYPTVQSACKDLNILASRAYTRFHWHKGKYSYEEIIYQILEKDERNTKPTGNYFKDEQAL